MGAETNLRACDASSRDIEATRRRIDAQAKLLEERLKPKSLLKPLRSRLESTLGEGGGRLLDAFREHPLPLSLAGLGLGWMLLQDLMGKKRAEARPAPGEGLASKAKEKVQQARETASDVAHKARDGARKASDWVSSTLEENPMLFAAGALAVGVLAGLCSPTTAKEEEVAGDLVEKAADSLKEKVENPVTGA